MTTLSALFIVTSFFLIRVVLPAFIILTAGTLLQRRYARQSRQHAAS